jgi:hypothetical protein
MLELQKKTLLPPLDIGSHSNATRQARLEAVACTRSFGLKRPAGSPGITFSLDSHPRGVLLLLIPDTVLFPCLRLADHRIRLEQQRRGERQPERLRGLEVDH